MKTGKEIPESSRLEFLEKFLPNNFALSDAEESTSGPSNREVIADLLFLRTLLAIFLASFWEVMDCFNSICKLTFEITEFTSLSVPTEYVSQSLWWTLKSPNTNTLADRLIEIT